MSSFNKITVVGHLGRDPVLRYTPQGTAVCDFSVATSERRSGGGEAQDITTWFKITLWGKQAEVANQYLSKGKQVYIEGRLRQTEYTDREGMKRTSLEVNATDIQFLGARGEEGATSSPAARPAATPASQNSSAATNDDRQPSDEDIPF